ncbi:hypothetical protein KUTeg_002009 [Tegillarca granosa]|uniref:C-type lectin domain-containing protein n=1 Tax=Tegillarca granosa TaxID=220873 RepID=A0ABQ9FT33_TEGGR|nr:hypothetical protein KUTeg_002009 [Tegillarca granosa]
MVSVFILGMTALSSGGESYLIGLSDQRYEGLFRWEGTGETVGLTDWWKGQPDNHKGNEDCVHIARSYGYSWNDVPCDNYKTSYICQKKVAGRNL